MQHVLSEMSNKNWRTVQNVAHQIAGRKARRSHYHMNIPREMQDRRRENAFKDIAGSAKAQKTAEEFEKAVKKVREELAKQSTKIK